MRPTRCKGYYSLQGRVVHAPRWTARKGRCWCPQMKVTIALSSFGSKAECVDIIHCMSVMHISCHFLCRWLPCYLDRCGGTQDCHTRSPSNAMPRGSSMPRSGMPPPPLLRRSRPWLAWPPWPPACRRAATGRQPSASCCRRAAARMQPAPLRPPCPQRLECHTWRAPTCLLPSSLALQLVTLASPCRQTWPQAAGTAGHPP